MAPKLKIFAKLKDILINSRASHLNSIVLHLKLKDFLSKLKYFSAKLKISANLFAPDGGQTLKKQACFSGQWAFVGLTGECCLAETVGQVLHLSYG